MTPVPIGILSTADHHFEGYAEILARSPDVEFVGIADADAEAGEAAASEFGTAHLSVDELLRRAEGVLVFSTYADRVERVETAANAGVDVLCEKPLAPTLDGAEAILDVCEANGVTLGMIMPLRFSEPVRQAREKLAAGDLGDLQSVVGTNRCAFRDRDEKGWTADPEATGGGGAVVHHSEHLVDVVRWLTGEEIVEVYAELGFLRDLPVEDSNLHSMRLSDGTTFTIDTSWSTPDEGEFWGDATLELICTDGRLSIDCFGQTFVRTRDVPPDAGVERMYWGDDLNQRVLEDFVTAVGTDASPRSDGADGLRQVEIIEASYESHESGAPVTVRRP